uniref:Uncharacterized protein n=1 Tax=Anopheles atroparvus TaxID=41427 RepID=A0A182J1R5_ANOAO
LEEAKPSLTLSNSLFPTLTIEVTVADRRKKSAEMPKNLRPPTSSSAYGRIGLVPESDDSLHSQEVEPPMAAAKEKWRNVGSALVFDPGNEGQDRCSWRVLLLQCPDTCVLDSHRSSRHDLRESFGQDVLLTETGRRGAAPSIFRRRDESKSAVERGEGGECATLAFAETFDAQRRVCDATPPISLACGPSSSRTRPHVLAGVVGGIRADRVGLRHARRRSRPQRSVVSVGKVKGRSKGRIVKFSTLYWWWKLFSISSDADGQTAMCVLRRGGFEVETKNVPRRATWATPSLPVR